MIITVLGSGTSFGVPTINCNCPVCLSTDPKDKRTRASVWIQDEESSILIDTATDFRQQALREAIPSVDAIFITHSHADHIHGLDDIRPFTRRRPVPVYANSPTACEFRERFSYIFKETQIGGGKPRIVLETLKTDESGLYGTVIIGSTEVQPVPLKHGELDTLGYRIRNFAYLTDCSFIPESSFDLLKGVEYLIIDALRYKPHPTHFSIPEAVEAVKKIGAVRTWITHICHDSSHKELEQKLPSGIAPAYDGLKVVI